MGRELGTARIAAGSGRIETARAPQPVRFDPRTWSGIVSGSDVYFWRVDSNPEWAAKVVLASEVDALVAAARPAAGLTAGAEALLIRAAARYSAEAQFAPTAEDGDAHLQYATERMAAIALAVGDRDRPVGVAAIRSLLS
ncbi:MAG TPA: hypothetical protein VF680_13835 [Allosphingosinicella sp.]|jgi:hypothetical protein